MKLRTEAPVNGGRNYNGPKVRFASLSKIWLYAGKSEYPNLREARRFVEGHGFSRAARLHILSTGALAPAQRVTTAGCRQSAGKIDRELSYRNPQRLYARFQIKKLARFGKDIVRTAWRHAESGRNVHFPSLLLGDLGVLCG